MLNLKAKLIKSSNNQSQTIIYKGDFLTVAWGGEWYTAMYKGDIFRQCTLKDLKLDIINGWAYNESRDEDIYYLTPLQNNNVKASKQIMNNSIKPKYFRTNKSVKSIHIETKEWFDKINGNSYNSNVITINRFCKNEFQISTPFTYGYDNYGEQISLEILQSLDIISSPYSYELHEKIKTIKHENCLKREVISWGLSCDNSIGLYDAKKMGSK